MKMLFFLIPLGLIPALIARGKGQSFGKWWLYGTMLFIVALPHALFMTSAADKLENKLSKRMNKSAAPH